MAALPEQFFQYASEKFAEHPDLLHHWSGPDAKGKRVLRIPKQEESGYDVEIQCETYGLYPYAEGWHGAPWDANTPSTNPPELCANCLGFVRSLLCPDASLTVSYTGGKPYKWALSYPIGNTRTIDRTGFLLFNYLGRRTSRVFKNHHLPSRHEHEVTDRGHR